MTTVARQSQAQVESPPPATERVGEKVDVAVRTLLRRAAELWVDQFGDQGYVSGVTSYSSLEPAFWIAAEAAWEVVHSERFPDQHRPLGARS